MASIAAVPVRQRAIPALALVCALSSGEMQPVAASLFQGLRFCLLVSLKCPDMMGKSYSSTDLWCERVRLCAALHTCVRNSQHLSSWTYRWRDIAMPLIFAALSG